MADGDGGVWLCVNVSTQPKKKSVINVSFHYNWEGTVIFSRQQSNSYEFDHWSAYLTFFSFWSLSPSPSPTLMFLVCTLYLEACVLVHHVHFVTLLLSCLNPFISHPLIIIYYFLVHGLFGLWEYSININ